VGASCVVGGASRAPISAPRGSGQQCAGQSASKQSGFPPECGPKGGPFWAEHRALFFAGGARRSACGRQTGSLAATAARPPMGRK